MNLLRRYPTERKRYVRAESEYKERIIAWAGCMVEWLIKHGLIEQGTKCERCGTGHKLHAHHDDYNKPHIVRWLCAYCHSQWHKDNPAVYPPHSVKRRRGGFRKSP